MSNFPVELKPVITHFNITPWIYDQWVAGHEAAHAVVALHFGGTVTAINTSSKWIAVGFSRASVAWTVPNALQTLHTIAAGPVYDVLYARQLGVPEEAIGRIMSDKDTAMKYIATINSEAKIYEDLWKNAIKEMAPILSRPDIAKRISILQPVVFQAIQETRSISGFEVLQLIGVL